MKLYRVMTTVVLGLTAAPLTASADDREVPLDQIPEAARATILDESAGGKVLSVEEETDDGRVQYEAHVSTPQGTYEIEVDPAGRLLKKERRGD